MITKPTASRSWLNITFTLALLGLISLSFGAASADGEEKGRAREGDRPREGEKEVDRPREGEGRRDGEREGDAKRRGARDGEDAAAREGELKISVLADGIIIGDKKITLINLRSALEKRTESSAVLYTKTGVPTQNIKTVINALSDSGIEEVRLASSEQAVRRRDGEGGRAGARDGEGGAPREGTRDGEMRREGPRDGEKRREGPRDGENRREGPRDGEEKRGDARDGGNELDARNFNMWNRIFKTYDKDNSKGVTFAEWVAMKNYELTEEQEEREKGWFDQADANSDAKITIGEWIDWKSNQGKKE